MRTPEVEELRYRGLAPSRIAEDLGCTTEHVLNLIKSGELEAANIGTGTRPLYRVRSTSYEAFLKQRKVA